MVCRPTLFPSCWSRCALRSQLILHGGLGPLQLEQRVSCLLPVEAIGYLPGVNGARARPCGVMVHQSVSRRLSLFFSRSILLDGKQRRRRRVEVDGSPEWRSVCSGASAKYHTTAWLKLGVKGQAKSTEYVANRQRALIKTPHCRGCSRGADGRRRLVAAYGTRSREGERTEGERVVQWPQGGDSAVRTNTVCRFIARL